MAIVKVNGKNLTSIGKVAGKNKADIVKVSGVDASAGGGAPAHNPLWVAIGRDGRLCHSTDAINWAEYTIPVGTSVDYWDLSFGKNGLGNDMWVISTGIASPELYTATDPTTDENDWSSVNFTTTHKTRAAEYGANGTWIATRNKNTGGTVQRSTDGGSSWTQISTGLSGVGLHLCIATDGNGLWVIGGVSKTIKSYDDGLTWHVSHAARGNRIEYNNGVWLRSEHTSYSYYATSISSNSSVDTWSTINVGSGSAIYWAVCHVSGNNWLLSRASDIYKSTDNCVSWAKVTRPAGISTVMGLATDGTTVVVCGKGSRIAYTTDLGATWTAAFTASRQLLAVEYNKVKPF